MANQPVSTDAAPRDEVNEARLEIWDTLNAEARHIQRHGEGSLVHRARLDELIEITYPQAIRAQATDEVKELVAVFRAYLHKLASRDEAFAALQRFEGR